MSRNAPTRKIARLIRKNPLVPWWRAQSRCRAGFHFEGHVYPYFYHRRNYTWTNERAVELPIAWKALQQHRGARVLEVGNVLSQYFPVDHEVVDKYEHAAGVINRDIVDFGRPATYDFIVSISTIEHVGWDERPEEPEKPLRALRHMMSLLRPQGELLVTLPVGYNPHLDRLLKEGALAFLTQQYLRRTTGSNRWVESSWQEVRGIRYDAPFDGANAVVVCSYRKDDELQRRRGAEVAAD